MQYGRDCFFYKIDPIPDQSIARFEYDAAASGIGLLYRKTNAHAETTYTSYDKMGRPLSETRTIGSTAVRFDYSYDPAGKQASKSATLNSWLFETLHYDFYSGKKHRGQAYTFDKLMLV